MKKYLVILFFVFTSCSSGENKSEKISVDLTKVEIGYINEVANSSIIINLPSDFISGEITTAKCYDNLIFFHDFYKNIIHIYDMDNSSYCKLSKKGHAGNEYGSIETFSFNKWKKEILIYDPKMRKVIVYSYPNMKAINKWDEDRSLMNIEYLNKDEIMIFSDDIENNVFIKNIETKEERSIDLDLLTSSMGLSYPQTLSVSGDNILYSKPYEYSDIYSFNSKGNFSVIYRILFGNNAFPEKYWKSENPLEFQENIVGHNYALMPQYLINNENKLLFWFLTSTDNKLNLAIYDKSSTNVKVYDELRIKGIKEPIKPIGIFKDYYISILETETLTIDRESIDSFSTKIVNNIDSNTQVPMLLLYKIK